MQLEVFKIVWALPSFSRFNLYKMQLEVIRVVLIDWFLRVSISTRCN